MKEFKRIFQWVIVEQNELWWSKMSYNDKWSHKSLQNYLKEPVK